MLSDIEITHQTKLEHISKVAARLGLNEDELELYGKFKAKISPRLEPSNSKLILVTAPNPTPYGEGKTTMSIGLADALNSLNKKVCLALREPSLGPVFGIKGGAAGGGYSQLAPMEDLNLHFTGDFHAITSANNLISAMIDNSLYQENPLKIEKILWKRCMDMNDRALRFITVGQGGRTDGVPREDGFNITAASEIMAVLCLATSLSDLKERVANIMVAYDSDKKPIYVRDLGCEDAVCILLKDAIKPNLFQTLEHTPTLVHGGPFANIAHGCNSVIATKTALNLADYVITEAGFVNFIKENATAIKAIGIFFPFIISAVLKTAQGSSTVAIITTASIMGAFSADNSLMHTLGFTTELSAALCVMAIASGAMCVSHANDSYFWVVTNFSKMSAEQGYRTQTAMTFIMGIVGIISVYILSLVLL